MWRLKESISNQFGIVTINRVEGKSGGRCQMSVKKC